MAVEVAVTGGIGSGKSTVSAALVHRGAALIDADRVVRDLQAPGSPVLAAMAEAFGSHILREDGSLDRQAVASVVFGDRDALERLNGIVHPALRETMARDRAELGATNDVVVLEIPLLVESGMRDFDGIVAVDVDSEVAVRRLVEHRGFTEDDARARIARQSSREDRLAIADLVIDNSGTTEELDAEVARCWDWIHTLDA